MRVLIGTRFAAQSEVDIWSALNMRLGLGNTIVVDAEPVAGPIYVQTLEGNMKQPICAGCGGQGPLRKRMDAIKRWAHLHRCERGARLNWSLRDWV